MNKSELLIKRRSTEEALNNIEQALNNFVPFNRENHPIIADMYMVKAAILGSMGKPVQAKQLSARALEIYKQNFNPEHMKVMETKKVLAAFLK